MSVFSLKKLIELAIGSPEPGYVNFYALQCVLFAFAEKLNIADEQIDCSKYEYGPGRTASETSIMRKLDELTRSSQSTRMLGGAEVADEENVAKEEGAENQTEAAAAEAEVAAEPAAEEAPQETVQETQNVEAAPEPEVAQATESVPATGNQSVEDIAAPTPIEEDALPQAKLSSVSIGPVGSHGGGSRSSTLQPAASRQSTRGKSDENISTSAAKQNEEINKTVRRALKDVKTTMGDMEMRISTVEGAMKQPVRVEEFVKGVSIMKDQLELVMGQLHMLTSVVTLHKDKAPVVEKLQETSNALYNVRKNNIFIESSHQIQKFDDNLITLLEAPDEEATADNPCMDDIISKRSSTSPDESTAEGANLDVDMHLTYTTDQLLDVVMELKTEVCTFTNKVNTLTASVAEADSVRTKRLLEDVQLDMNEIRVAMAALREAQEWLGTNQRQISSKMEGIFQSLNALNEEKVDKTELTILLAEKADYTQLQKKVSQEQMMELQCRIEKQFCEVRKLIANHTENIMQTIDHVRNAVGPKAVEEIVKKHKDKLEHDINALRDILQKYIAATNDDCLAAGARIKVLQDLACLCCDTTCNMRTVERSKVPKLPSAHASNMLAPLITYELGSIRKSGVMGYYRKDEFPHSPGAWMQRQKLNMKQCGTRHAGGAHTITTPKDRVEKITLSKK